MHPPSEQLLGQQLAIFQQPLTAGQPPRPQLAQPWCQVLHPTRSKAAVVPSKPASSQAQFDEELVQGLSSWIRCATQLGQVAASVAAEACCSKAANQQAEEDAAVASQHSVTGSTAPPQQKQQQGSPAEEALRKASHKLLSMQHIL